MKLNYYKILSIILKKNNFNELLEQIKSRDNISEDFVLDYCELLLMIGISKTYRECYIKDELIKRLGIDEDVNNIYFRYKRYIDEIIEFYVSCDDEYSGEHLYTELERGVEPYKLRYIS